MTTNRVHYGTPCQQRHPSLSINALAQSHIERCRQEVKALPFWRDVVCEGIASFFLVSIQSSVCLSWGKPEGVGSSLGCITAMACAITILIEIFGPLGGAHMNPAVSVSFVLAGKVTALKGFIYIIVQSVGSIAGSGLIYWLTPLKYQETLAATTVNENLTVWQGLVTEIWVTSLLVMTVFASENRDRRPVFMHTIVIGFGVLVGASAGAAYSGASMNPTRSLGPAVVKNVWEHHWIYWVGPITGGLIATVLYVYVFDAIGNPSSVQETLRKIEELQAQIPTSIKLSGAGMTSMDNKAFVLGESNGELSKTSVHM